MGRVSDVLAEVWSAEPPVGDVSDVLAEVWASPYALPVPALPARHEVRELVWLLDVDLGGAPLRLATEEITVQSREDGDGGRLHHRGLPDLSVPLGAESLSVTVPVVAPAARHAQVRQFVGRPFVLRLYRGAGDLEDAVVVLQGMITGASWLGPDAPESVSLELARGAPAASSTILSPTQVVDSTTWLDTVYRVAPAASGAAYPIVIGSPGREPIGGDTYPAVPALQVGTVPTARILLVCAGHVTPGTTVQVHDLSEDGGAPETRAVTLGTDDLGQPCTTVSMFGASKDPPDDSALYTGWFADQPATLFEGAPIRGLGTLLLWGSCEFSRTKVDVGAMRSVRDRLDRYVIDTVINDPSVRWADWVEANLLETYGLERVEGAGGVWYREQVYRVDPARVRATLTTTSDTAGILVRRASGYSETLDDPVSEITVRYGPIAASGSTYQGQVTVGSERRPDDPRAVASPLCRRAREILGGPVARTWQVGTTADHGTALAIAQRLAERYALPATYVELEGGPDLADLVAYDTVEIADPDLPATVLGLVEPGITLTESGVRVTVRIPGS